MRLKALQEIYAYRQSEETDLSKAERHLLESVDNLYELFVCQLSFWVELKRFAERRIEENRHKHFPTEEDLNPNLKFVNNQVINALEYNKHLLALEDKYKINWINLKEDFIRSVYGRITELPEYQRYMNNGKHGFQDDRRFLMEVTDKYMAEEAFLYDFYSDQKLSFNSDYQLSVYLLWKFLSELPEDFNEASRLPAVYNETRDGCRDEDFVVKLFEKTILKAQVYRQLVNDNISNWDYDRLALMDKIIIFMALTELCEFHFIPVKVTINEYIEISKLYSTPESRRFVNGVLDKLVEVLKSEGKIVKTGIGLMDR